MKKRILAVFLALCMVVSLLPVTALAEDAQEPAAGQAEALPPRRIRPSVRARTSAA